MERWRAELTSVGWPAERLAEAIDAAAAAGLPARISFEDARRLISGALAPDGELARRKAFSRRHVLVELAPRLYGQDPALLADGRARAWPTPRRYRHRRAPVPGSVSTPWPACWPRSGQ